MAHCGANIGAGQLRSGMLWSMTEDRRVNRLVYGGFNSNL